MKDSMLHDLHEYLRSHHFGKYRGTVIDTDPATMRVKASVPSVLGDTGSSWATACVPYAGPQVGFFMLPEIGSGVWIEFEAGDVSFPVWTGCYWNGGEIPSSAAATLKTIITTAGTLSFDNSAASVTLQDSAQHTVVINSSGITATGGSGVIAAGASGVSINNGALEVM
jgi:uncharacterized protein involved in type VI secretion and phage assembly